MEPVGFALCEWSEIKVESIDYGIQIVTYNTADRLTCWLSDFSSLWHETITMDNMAKRYKECNPLLELYDKKELILSKYTTHPENANNLSMVRNDDMLKLCTKNYISDGSDNIPLKFYWLLERAAHPAIYGKFTKSVLKDIISLQQLNKGTRDRMRAVVENCENESPTSFIHSGPLFSCNNCNEDIFGTRYNCLDCLDYDLCGDCINIQHDHIMVRYAHPEDENRFKRSFERVNEFYGCNNNDKEQ